MSGERALTAEEWDKKLGTASQSAKLDVPVSNRPKSAAEWDRVLSGKSRSAAISGPGLPQKESELAPPRPAYEKRPGLAKQAAAGVGIGATDMAALPFLAGDVIRAVGAAASPKSRGTRLDVAGRIMSDPSNISSRMAQFTQEQIDERGIPDPEGFVERTARFGGEAVGSSLFPAARVATGPLRAGKAAKTLGVPLRHAGQVAAESPKKWLAQEAVSVAGEGVGRAAAPDDMLSQLGGGVGGAVGPLVVGRSVRTGLRAARNAVHLARGEVPEALAHARAAERLQSTLGTTPEAVDAARKRIVQQLKEWEARRVNIGGMEDSQSTLAGIASAGPDSAGLRTLQNDLAAIYPEYNSALTMLRGKENELLKTRLAELGSYNDTPIDAAKSAAEARVDLTFRQLEERTGLNYDRIQDELAAVRLTGDSGQLSEDTIAMMSKLDDELYEPLRNRYKEIMSRFDETGAQTSSSPYADALQKLKIDEGLIPAKVNLVEAQVPTRILDAEGKPQLVTKMVEEETPEFQWRSGNIDADIVKQLGNLPPNASPSFFHKLDVSIKEAIREAPPGAESYKRKMKILAEASRQIRENIMEGRVTFDGPASKADRELAAQLGRYLAVNDANYRGYKSVWRKMFDGRRSNVTPTGKVLGPAKNGVAVENALDTYVSGRATDRSGIQNYRRAFQMAPSGKFSQQFKAGEQAMEDHIVMKIYDRASQENGGVGGAKLKKARVDFRVALEEYPGAAKRIATAEMLETEAKDLGAWKTRTTKELNRDRIHDFVRDPETEVSKILRTKSKAAQKRDFNKLMMQVGAHARKDRLDGLRTIVWDQILEQATRRPDTVGDMIGHSVVDGLGLREAMRKNKGVLEALYTPKELKIMDDLSYQATINEHIKIPSGTRNREDAESVALQVITRSRWMSPIWSTGRKAIHTGRALSWLNEKLLTTESGHVLQAAMNEPFGLGLKLMMMDTPATRNNIRRWVGVNIPSLLPRLAVQPGEENTQ